MGEIVGAIVGMTLLGAGLAWIIRRIRSIDFGISVGVAMLIIAFAAGFTNTSAERPYWLTVTIYLAAAIPAYFIVQVTRSRSMQHHSAANVEPQLEPSGGFAAAFDGDQPQARRDEISASGSSIAWRRGFFRIWAVLALLWAVVVLLFAAGSVMDPYVPTKIVATKVNAAAAQLFDTYGEPYNGWSTAAFRGELVATEVRPGYRLFTRPEVTGAALSADVDEARQLVDAYIKEETVSRRSSAILPLAAGVVVPPLVILVLGVLVGWAISGFRRTA